MGRAHQGKIPLASIHRVGEGSRWLTVSGCWKVLTLPIVPPVSGVLAPPRFGSEHHGNWRIFAGQSSDLTATLRQTFLHLLTCRHSLPPRNSINTVWSPRNSFPDLPCPYFVSIVILFCFESPAINTTLHYIPLPPIFALPLLFVSYTFLQRSPVCMQLGAWDSYGHWWKHLFGLLVSYKILAYLLPWFSHLLLFLECPRSGALYWFYCLLYSVHTSHEDLIQPRPSVKSLSHGF